MNLAIVLDKRTVHILLKNKLELIDETTIEEKNNLSNVLLTEMDNIIKRNKLPKNRIENISVKSDLPDSYTSARIARSIAKSFLFSKKSA